MGEFAVKFIANHFGGFMKVSGAGVIAKACPEGEYVVTWRIGKALHGRKPRHKALVVIDDGSDLGLLQHNLRNPHPIWSDVLLPGQVFATSDVEPCQQLLAEAWFIT